MRRALVLCFSVFLATEAWAKEPQAFELSNEHRAAVEKGVRERLKDPESARFGTMAAAKTAKRGILVCGMVNAKNALGGYAGAAPFVGTLTDMKFDDGKRAVLFSVAGLGDDETRRTVVARMCREGGVKF